VLETKSSAFAKVRLSFSSFYSFMSWRVVPWLSRSGLQSDALPTELNPRFDLMGCTIILQLSYSFYSILRIDFGSFTCSNALVPRLTILLSLPASEKNESSL